MPWMRRWSQARPPSSLNLFILSLWPLTAALRTALAVTPRFVFTGQEITLESPSLTTVFAKQTATQFQDATFSGGPR